MPESSSSAPRPSPSGPDLLARIDSPADLKQLTLDELPVLCAQTREFLLQSVQQTGGHLGSNLGVVELATALHYVFDLERDPLEQTNLAADPARAAEIAALRALV